MPDKRFILGSQFARDNQLIKLLRESCINFLRIIAVSTGLTKNNIHPSSMHSLSQLLCATLKNGNEDWCNLTLVRSIAQTQQICKAFSTKAWVNMLLGFLSREAGGGELNLPKQILTVRLLQTVLKSWDLDHPDILQILEKLLHILGHITLTCSYDTENKSTAESKSVVLLTQSHSSTLSQEIINLLRTLHRIVGWNQVLNSILVQKLNLAAYFADGNTLTSVTGESSTTDSQHYMVIACLSMIGSWDVRPRIGAVVEIDNLQGTIVRTTQKGKLCVQLHGSGEVKKVPLNAIKPVSNPVFSLERMPLNENLIKTWANLLLNKQSTSLNNSERRPIHGIYG